MAQYCLVFCYLQFRAICMNIRCAICINGNIAIGCPHIPIFINTKRTLCR